MEYSRKPYFKLSCWLLSAVGLWPYQNIWGRLFMRCFTNFVLFLMLTRMMLNLIWYGTSTFLETLPISILLVTYISVLFNSYFNVGKVKDLLHRVEADWACRKSDDEIKILHRQAEIGRKINLAYTIYVYIAVTIFIAQAHLDRSLPQWKSYNSSVPLTWKRNSPKLIQNNFATLTMYTVLLSHQSIIMIFIHHACGMYLLLLHRLKQTLDETKANAYTYRYDEVYCQIASCVDLHLNIIQFTTDIDSCYGIYFLLIISGNSISMCIFIEHLVLALLRGERGRLANPILIFAALIFLFLSNSMGQTLTDISAKVGVTVYNGQWYKKSMSVQKILLLIIRKSHEPCTLSAYKFYTLSHTSFKTIINTIVSYCLVIHELSK